MHREESRGIMSNEGKVLHELLVNTGSDPVNVDGVERALKDAMPGNRPSTGYLYEGGPFSLIQGDVLSQVTNGGSPLLQWLPTRGIVDKNQLVNHLEYVAPEGFTGADSYREWLRTVVLDECAGGPSTSWNGFSYQMSGGRFRWQTKTMTAYPDGGARYYEQMPVYTVRGAQPQQLSSDREWAVARLMMAASQHASYVVLSGDRNNSNMEWDGLSTILTPGYVQARKVGTGNPTWADPEYVNGATLTTKAALMGALRGMVRRIMNRIRMRNWVVSPNDMAIVMPAAMWDNLAEDIAAGALYRYTNTYGFSGEMSIDTFENRYREVRTGGLGFGTINIDGVNVPVLADPNMGMNVTINPAGTPKPGVTGDIYVLTRRVNGIAILEQQYVDYNRLQYPTNGLESMFTLQGGLARAGWVTEANNCYYYYIEMQGRVVSLMQPLQGVIRSATVETLVDSENESGTFTSPDFYGFGKGNQGGKGVAHLDT